MTLPFTETLRGHGRVISWPNLNTVLSQGIGKPEERERDGDGWSVGQSEYKQHLLSLSGYMGTVCGAPKQLQ